jgi:hypothetical protein
MKILVAASLLIAIAGTAISIFGQIQVRELADNKVVAGTIRRMDENGWFVLDDKNHTPINIAKIEIVGSNILIHYTFTASTIHSFIVTPDETLAASGFFLGAAVHRDYAAITLSQVNKNGSAELVHPSAIRSKFGNIWIHGLFSVD